MLIPADALSSAALEGLMREFILSHSQGDEEQLLDATVFNRIKAGLKSGELVISYAEHNDSVAIRLRSELPPASDDDAFSENDTE